MLSYTRLAFSGPVQGIKDNEKNQIREDIWDHHAKMAADHRKD
jgi:hypothetical protein